ncbi:CDGSH iron-sulfur domain-containing protein [Hasllibacter sp. MH4015]|uniref:CDGSH iron-sulfur domain-containing protein n=1 Tax=Hasllibacter sp. MH4015 TaxID=2854029 RepID=UPI001CD1C952|nr:CDGSH iron-sulfur domain-containing protein [Hasllibacter sp. MH4015]
MAAKIETKENGPLIVSGAPDLRAHDGSAIEGKPRMALCRCGQSSTKPFCDGTHNEIGWSETPDKAPSRAKPISYEAEVEEVPVTVTYSKALCSHAANCVKMGEGAFDPERKPWVKPEETTIANLRAIIDACPSGALQLAVGAGAPSHGNPSADQMAITVAKDGPYYVENVAFAGGAFVADSDGSTQKYALCRCGLSSTRPFCDGSHYDAGWTDGD